MQKGELYCGAISGMISDIISAGDVVRNIVTGYSGVVASLKQLC